MSPACKGTHNSRQSPSSRARHEMSEELETEMPLQRREGGGRGRRSLWIIAVLFSPRRPRVSHHNPNRGWLYLPFAAGRRSVCSNITPYSSTRGSHLLQALGTAPGLACFKATEETSYFSLHLLNLCVCGKRLEEVKGAGKPAVCKD